MEDIQLFEEYIAGRLNPEETERFESRLKNDKNFASDFKIYLFTVKGIIQEAEQENADFGNAMKHISKDELLEIIGRRKSPGIFKYGYLRERAAWAAGIAALFIVCFVCIFFTLDVGNKNIDNMVVKYNYYADARDGNESVDINSMSKKEIKEYLPVLISQYENCPATDVQECQDAGIRIALVYLKLHDRKAARKWLNDLIQRFWDDKPFVAQCEQILDEID